MKAEPTNVKEARKEAMDSSLCSLIAVVSREKNMSAGEYIKEATTEAMARSLDMSPHVLKQLDMSPSEELDLIKEIAVRDGVRVSDYIREAVVKAVARDIRTFERELREELEGSEPWAFSC